MLYEKQLSFHPMEFRAPSLVVMYTAGNLLCPLLPLFFTLYRIEIPFVEGKICGVNWLIIFIFLSVIGSRVPIFLLTSPSHQPFCLAFNKKGNFQWLLSWCHSFWSGSCFLCFNNWLMSSISRNKFGSFLNVSLFIKISYLDRKERKRLAANKNQARDL